MKTEFDHLSWINCSAQASEQGRDEVGKGTRLVHVGTMVSPHRSPMAVSCHWFLHQTRPPFFVEKMCTSVSGNSHRIMTIPKRKCEIPEMPCERYLMAAKIPGRVKPNWPINDFDTATMELPSTILAISLLRNTPGPRGYLNMSL